MATLTLRIPDDKHNRLKGDKKRGLELLDKLDKAFVENVKKMEIS